MNFALGGGCASGGLEVCLVIAWHRLFNPMDALWKRDAGHVQEQLMCQFASYVGCPWGMYFQ